jgi:hypothetical protein
MRFLTVLVLATLAAAPAIAQQPPPPADQQPAAGAPAASPPSSQPPPEQQPPPETAPPAGTPPQQAAEPPEEREPPNTNASKRTVCLNKVRHQGLRGADRINAIQLCVEEARLSCLKKAIAQKINGPARRDYLRTCSG